MTKIVQRTDPVNRTPDIFETSIMLNYNCNYKCSYCAFESEKTRKATLNLSDYNLMLDKIKENTQFQNYIFYLIGGEPTVNPILIDIIELIISKFPTSKIEIQTNTSNSINRFSNFIKYKQVGFICSYHHQMEPDFNIWLDKIDYLFENDILAGIDYMLEYDDQETIYKNYQILKQKPYNSKIQIGKLRTYAGLPWFDYDKSDIYREIIKDEHDEKILLTYTDGSTEEKIYANIYSDISFKYYLCDSVYMNILIDIDGNAYACFAGLNKQPLFNLLSISTSKLKGRLSHKHICTHEYCTCELWLSKERIFKKLK